MKKVNVEKTKQVRGGFVGALAGLAIGVGITGIAATLAAGEGCSR
ncbi:hypothetical protein [Photobacterium leiognathi]|nr:hypothetical protein [Photobacterium leiognathi]